MQPLFLLNTLRIKKPKLMFKLLLLTNLLMMLRPLVLSQVFKCNKPFVMPEKELKRNHMKITFPLIRLNIHITKP